MFDARPEEFLPFLVFSIPIIAIIGGITIAIVKALGRQRMVEMVQQERIAAIQKGIDITQLPPLPAAAFDDDEAALLGLTGAERDRRLSQGLLIGGLITTFAGAGLIAFLAVIAQPDNIWAVGLIPGMVGIALLLSSWIVSSRGRGNAPPR